jgi:hypothetical protein
MSTCEDFPACGHEQGCCPDFDPTTGAQLNMKCTCGATVPLTSRSSLCAGCLRSAAIEDGDFSDDYDDFSDDEDDLDEDEPADDED